MRSPRDTTRHHKSIALNIFEEGVMGCDGHGDGEDRPTECGCRDFIFRHSSKKI